MEGPALKKNAAFWLERGYCYTKLEKFDEATKAFAQAIELAPKEAQGYLALADCYMLMEDFDEAAKICDLGLTFANAHQKAVWAKSLKSDLEIEKQKISKHYTESQYGTFIS